MNITSLIPREALKSAFIDGFIVPLIVPFETDLNVQQVFSLFRNESYAALLETPAPCRAPVRHRFSYILRTPVWSLRYQNGEAVQQFKTGTVRRWRAPVLEALRSTLDPYKGTNWPDLHFFTGGALGCFGYELAGQFETLPAPHIRDKEMPDAFWALYDQVLVFDHLYLKQYVVQNLLPGDASFETSYEQAVRAVGNVLKRITGDAETDGARVIVRDIRQTQTAEDFCRMVRTAKRYIAAGDIYQANLSQAFTFEADGDVFEIYRALQSINPSPFAAYLNWGALKILSASPERLVKKEKNRVFTRPIAGTRRRGAGFEEEERLKSELLLSEKERAEHLMLVDLERNDLGRVARFDSVRVDEWMTVETYSHVHHIVSNVTGELAEGVDRFDLFKALFPGGTITGCPKIRSMEIIHELEGAPRGFYTGALGYVAFNGDLDLNILIRTLVLNGTQGSFRVGAGIVADSSPRFEYEETLHKAGALLEALKRFSETKKQKARSREAVKV